MRGTCRDSCPAARVSRAVAERRRVSHRSDGARPLVAARPLEHGQAVGRRSALAVRRAARAGRAVRPAVRARRRSFGPPDLQRIGTFWFSPDFSQYEAAMREGARQTAG